MRSPTKSGIASENVQKSEEHQYVGGACPINKSSGSALERDTHQNGRVNEENRISTSGLSSFSLWVWGTHPLGSKPKQCLTF